jgi:hypothetical protein
MAKDNPLTFYSIHGWTEVFWMMISELSFQLFPDLKGYFITMLRTVTICVFLKTLTPALSRRERAIKAAILARGEYM